MGQTNSIHLKIKNKTEMSAFTSLVCVCVCVCVCVYGLKHICIYLQLGELFPCLALSLNPSERGHH